MHAGVASAVTHACHHAVTLMAFEMSCLCWLAGLLCDSTHFMGMCISKCVMAQLLPSECSLLADFSDLLLGFAL